MAQVDIALKLYTQTCCNCGIHFGVPDDFDDRRRSDHQTFYCPSGHAQSYVGKTEAEKLKQELATRTAALVEAERRLQAETNMRRSAQQQEKTAKTKLRKTLHRVEHGVCPQCHQTFSQLAAHMKNQHGK